MVGLLCVLGAVTGAGYFHHEGWRWYAVTSPSMGQTLPTGSLLVTAPTTFSDVGAGDVITFHSPGSHEVFSHRVVAVTPDGLTTRGDVNLADDAWTITDQDLIGSVAWHVPGVGWLLRGVPLLLLGSGLTWLLTLLARGPRRYSLRMVGISLTTAAVSWRLRPWVGLDQLSQTTPDDGSRGVLMQVISTGLLPVRTFEVDGHAQTTLRNGQVATLHLDHPVDGRFDLATRIDLGWWGWALVILLVLTPLLWSLVRGLPPLPAPVPPPAAAPLVAPLVSAPLRPTLLTEQHGEEPARTPEPSPALLEWSA